jgi:UDP:flavonoid glycosyltransferase YjiC (YdhE family)
MVAAIGWTGHAFPALALARELHARGHEVLVESFERWRQTAGELGVGFAAAPERMSFPGLAGEPGEPRLAQVARQMAPLLDDFRPDVVVSDLFTLAPALAAEVAGIPRVTLIPHPYPVRGPGLPFYPLGLLPPRTPLGALAWRALWPAAGTRLPNTRLREVRAEIDCSRAELGLGPLADYDGQISEELALVATFPQLEYPRRWPGHVHVIGPLPFELPHPEVELPPGDRPLVVVAASTERDPGQELIRTALEALAEEPVRVLASTNRRGTAWRGTVPDNAGVVDWLPYRQALPKASLVICHGGHGTVGRALLAGAPVLVVPAAGDMAENGARVSWARAGAMVPQRLLGPAPLRWAARRLLGDAGYRERARELAAWARGNDGAAAGAGLIEELAR